MKMKVAIVLAALFAEAQGLAGSNETTAANVLNLNLDEDSLDECRDYHSIGNSSEICEFVKTADDCQMDEGFINYITFVLCDTKPSLLPAVYVLYILWLLFLFVALGTTAENFFCPALEFIAHNLKLSQNIAGITVVAFGNGAPDIFSAIAAFLNATPGSTGVAIGALLGAGMFVTTVVAGAVSITGQIEVAQRPFLRDLTFYIMTVFWTFCLLYKGQIDIFNSLGFLMLYAIYVIVVLVGRYVNQRLRRKNTENVRFDEHSPLINDNKAATNSDISTAVVNGDGDWIDQPLRVEDSSSSEFKTLSHINEAIDDEGGNESDDDSEVAMEDVETSQLIKAWSMVRPFSRRKWHTLSKALKVLELIKMPILLLCSITIPVFVSDPEKKRNWSRVLTIFHCILSPMFAIFATKAGTVKLGGKFPLWALMLLIGIALAIIVRFTSRKFERPRYYWAFAYIGFIISIIWTYCIANEIVNLLRTFGAVLDVSNVIMGLTLLAWGNSIGDMIADVTLSRQGFPRMAISACFGGPLFNLIIGVGLPCTIVIIKTGKPILITFTLIEAVLTGGLLFSLCFSFIIVPLRKFKMTRIYGIVLIAIYVVYLPIALLTGAGIIR